MANDIHTTRAHDGLLGKWKSILSARDFTEQELSGNHGPCPICNGKDRFRFDDRRMGMWFCTHCGSGDGLKLLQLKEGISFVQALDIAKGIAGVVDEDKPKPDRTVEDKRKALTSLWRGSRPNTPELQAYLASRGLAVAYADDPVVRWHPDAKWSVREDDGRIRRGSHPAMLLRYFQRDSKGHPVPVTIHRVWPQGCPKRKMVMPTLLKMDGIFCPLGGRPVDGVLGVAEGAESAWSLRQLGENAFPVWSVYSAEQMTRFDPPRELKVLHIGMDVDYSLTGQAAAYELGKRLRVKRPEIEINMVRPAQVDHIDWDFNDELQRRLKE